MKPTVCNPININYRYQAPMRSRESADPAVVLYKDTGTESTSPLIAFIDSGTGLPTPAGVNSIIVRWDNGSNKIFKL